MCIQGEELTEPFTFPLPWSDPDGALTMSAKQQRKLVGMKRFSDVLRAKGLSSESCAMIKAITPYSITQDTISDCSFVASLCIASAFEKRFRKQLITRIIFPQASAEAVKFSLMQSRYVREWSTADAQTSTRPPTPL